MARDAKLTIVCGRRGTSKTNTTLTRIFKAVRGTQQNNFMDARKALIFDAMDEFRGYKYRDNEPPLNIKAIYYRDIPRFTAQTPIELVRVRPITDDNKRMTTEDKQYWLSYVLQNYYDGIFLIEDINRFVSDNAPNDIIGSLATLRQAGVDLIIHYQLIGKAGNPKILGMANYIRLHKTNDSVKRHKDKFEDKTDILMVAEKIVNRRYEYGRKNKIKDDTGQYFSCTVDLDDHKIRGIFTKEEAIAAVRGYMNDNAKMTVKDLMQQLDENGKKVWKDYASAYKYLENKYMEEFFIFD